MHSQPFSKQTIKLYCLTDTSHQETLSLLLPGVPEFLFCPDIILAN